MLPVAVLGALLILVGIVSRSTDLRRRRRLGPQITTTTTTS
jgi:hypothetical protein